MRLLCAHTATEPSGLAAFILHAVADECRERGLAYSEVLEFEGFAEPLEQALAGAEGHRGDDDRELVDQPGRQGLAGEVCAAHHMHLLLAGCGLGRSDRLGEAPGEDEVVARWLLCGAMGDHEERDAPG